jgi:hypothetical protein
MDIPLWLASAARAIDGSVTTIEFADYEESIGAGFFFRGRLE